MKKYLAAGVLAAALLGTALGGCAPEPQNGTQEVPQALEDTLRFSITDTFRGLKVEAVAGDVRLLPSSEDRCVVVCSDTSGFSYTAVVEEDMLVIQEKGESSFSKENGEILVYLPQPRYDSLNITTESGSVDVTMDFAFGDVNIRTVAGETAYRGTADGSMSLESESGRILITGVSPNEAQIKTESGSIIAQSVLVGEDLNIQTVTGDLTLAYVKCKNATVTVANGQSMLEQVLALEHIQLTGQTGNVVLTDCDAATLEIKTTAGNVTGTLLTDKRFHTDTETGEVTVPDTTGGVCHVITESGNIHLQIGGSQ